MGAGQEEELKIGGAELGRGTWLGRGMGQGRGGRGWDEGAERGGGGDVKTRQGGAGEVLRAPR